MTTQRTPRRARIALAAAAVIAGGLFAAVTGSAQAAPLAPAAAETVAGDVGATAVHWRGVAITSAIATTVTSASAVGGTSAIATTTAASEAASDIATTALAIAITGNRPRSQRP